LGQILLKVTREATMTALDYVKAVQAAGQAAGPGAGSVVATPVKQVRMGRAVRVCERPGHVKLAWALLNCYLRVFATVTHFPLLIHM
jgi:hypothetical protein